MAIPLPLIAVAAAASLNPAPVTSFLVRVEEGGTPTRVEAVQGPYRERVQMLLPDGGTTIRRSETEYTEGTAGFPGGVRLNQPPALPDQYGLTLGQNPTIAYLAGRARSGDPVFTATILRGIPVVRATIPLRANECAGLPKRTRTVWLTRAHLLPLRIDERALTTGAVLQHEVYRYSAINQALAPDLFVPRHDPNATVTRGRFVRATPGQAAASLPYTPKMPTTMVTGFSRTVTGWAPKGGILGVEGSIPPSPGLFQAIWRRGLERIELTMRKGAAWPTDPFGGECMELSQEPVTINGAAGVFGAGPSSPPHLFWQSGGVRYTLSGPLPKATLVKIAQSLTTVG